MRDREVSPWWAGRLGRRGRPTLLFGVSYEDVAVELEVLRDAQRILVIGASGDVAAALAADHRTVTAVDVNAAQVAYVRERLEGGSRRPGRADRLLTAARLPAPVVGWTTPRIERFLRMGHVDRQARFFDAVLDTLRFRVLTEVGLAPATLLRAYRPEFVRFLPTQFGRLLRGRLRRGIATHANRSNPYATLLFTGRAPAVPSAAGPVDVRCADVAAFLERQPPGSFDGLALSNVLDGPDVSYRARLARAVARAGTPDAPVVLRTLREPTDREAARWAARDRSMIWGGILVTGAPDFPDAVRALS